MREFNAAHLLSDELRKHGFKVEKPFLDMPPVAKAIGNYRQGAFIRAITRAGRWDEVIMLTQQGKVSETTGANVGRMKDGKLITSSLIQGVLKGITRGIALKLALDIGLKTQEREFDISELYLADEVFICGTGHGEVTLVVAVDNIDIGEEAGENVTKIRDLYFDVVSGKRHEYMDLLTPVY